MKFACDVPSPDTVLTGCTWRSPGRPTLSPPLLEIGVSVASVNVRFDCCAAAEEREGFARYWGRFSTHSAKKGFAKTKASDLFCLRCIGTFRRGIIAQKPNTKRPNKRAQCRGWTDRRKRRMCGAERFAVQIGMFCNDRCACSNWLQLRCDFKVEWIILCKAFCVFFKEYYVLMSCLSFYNEQICRVNFRESLDCSVPNVLDSCMMLIHKMIWACRFGLIQVLLLLNSSILGPSLAG